MTITRHQTYDLLINRKTDITFLQETHSTPESVRKWKKEWKGKPTQHSGTISKSSGVAILFKENSNIEIIDSQKDKEGEIIQCSIHFEQELFQLRNINIQDFTQYDKKILLPGDFNMIENIFLDRLGRNPNNAHTIGTQTLNLIKNKHKLIDIWRKNNPFQKYLSYHNTDKILFIVD